MSLRVIDSKYYSHPSQYTMSLPNKSHRHKYYSHPSQYTMSLPNKNHKHKYYNGSKSQSPKSVHNITVTQVLQCPYPIRVIDISITVTQVSTQCPYPNKSHRHKYYSHPSQYTMSYPMVRVIDVYSHPISTQCPYPIRVIDPSQ